MRSFLLIVALIVNLVRSDGRNPISAPRAGATVPAETSYTIRWSPGTPGPVKIELHYADTAYINITESTENDGNFDWMPSAVFDGKDNFYLAICDLLVARECTYTFNGRFAIASGSLTSTLSSTRSASTTVTRPSSSSTTFQSTSIISALSFTPSASSTTTTVASSMPSSSPGNGGGLSSSATIAIAVVFAVIGTALVGLGLLFWHRKWQQRNRGRGQTHEGSEVVYKQEGMREDATAELEGIGHSELAVQDMPEYVIHELPERAR
ncbi:hypothetical protein CC86DRAFT_403351 [Ophiobolus disseminans]|uniref:Yeast cell wall synthesis Kre9/Knh1-like N-terminal domain-containing protein n=1 Tax=Ophiobolus disseminans TaxID=1469910 RepID=A0A6A7A9Z8_9PLEO|nr:hypothetical protein CC86DRAFT_403351 [Ophiobolus disseminans]